MENSKKHHDQDPEGLKSQGEDKGKHNYNDPSGTDPERYEKPGLEGDERTTNYGKKPENHTTTEERMINPDRGV